MDFKSIATETHQYNFHSHTQFCDGHAPMETMARAAVAAGMRHYGFSPHSPIPIASPCNMQAEDVPVYLAEYRRIASLPELAACRFYASMEVDYLGPQWGPASDYFRELPLDYMIGSVHFIPTQKGEYVDIDGNFETFGRRLHEKFDDDMDYIVDTFFAQSTAMVEAGGFDIIGHFDKIGLNAEHFRPGTTDSTFYTSRLDGLIEAIIDSGVAIELNTKAYERHGRFFPEAGLLRRLVDAGVTILVNSDAHYPELVTAGREEGFAVLHKAESHG